jgi:hypothetical protein
MNVVFVMMDFIYRISNAIKGLLRIVNITIQVLNVNNVIQDMG